MSSDPPSGAPSAQSDHDEASDRRLSRPALVRLRGAALFDGLERHLPGSREHAEAAGSYAFAVAVEMDLGRDRVELIREVARLHEVGMVYLPAELVVKEWSKLSTPEREQLDARFETGRDLARGAGLPEEVCDWILKVGERFDGKGPGRMAGDSIPIESRIVRAACACDAALAAGGDAVGDLDGMAGAELDPQVVAALRLVLERARASGPT